MDSPAEHFAVVMTGIVCDLPDGTHRLDAPERSVLLVERNLRPDVDAHWYVLDPATGATRGPEMWHFAPSERRPEDFPADLPFVPRVGVTLLSLAGPDRARSCDWSLSAEFDAVWARVDSHAEGDRPTAAAVAELVVSQLRDGGWQATESAVDAPQVLPRAMIGVAQRQFTLGDRCRVVIAPEHPQPHVQMVDRPIALSGARLADRGDAGVG